MPVSVLVVNASPLILLSKIDALSLLKAVGSRWCVPEAVVREIEVKGQRDPVATTMTAATWLERVSVAAIPPEVSAWNLDDGEASVVAFALSLPAAITLLDDRAGRNCARAMKLQVMGTAGLLLAARSKGLIPAVEPILRKLVAAGMYLSPQAATEILKRAGEER
ncbi:MAG: DUF3368 domain-containing protein [Candidatus Brocadiae bacterium]|nr:DUF3368 domain-containing protein [Candidatus Brocadiia bacterium]